MNFLAHLYLSGEDEKLITGNFIGDHVKGNNYLKYPEKIREGIVLHRRIDSFTDQHTLFRETKKLFREEFGLYSGVITDLVFDHFLASGWEQYHQLTLRKFAGKMHAALLSNVFHLPSRVKLFLPAMIKSRRLESYAQKEGIQQSLEIMSRHTSLPKKSVQAIKIMVNNDELIRQYFTGFMNEMIAFSESETDIKIKRPDNYH
ncbi:Acyl carrier protein phosphodiesterase [Mariniphaga anaerophila]|uniref:Acyl carrier protein phosphodiesterase n=1 Tax=Mariniphaga anaerophila TaxID=1484053 RepID=A0A1M5FW94_9BACT|nr:ACP phosphodiesterase [Mariniphaga anaerophila]SHF95768.1 Acyl carrier protein phosphodiesterase [Mariniphaga anaerophila]